MAKRKIRDEIRKPDVLQTFAQQAIVWIKENKARCIIAAAVVVAVLASGWGYGLYRANKDEKAQYLLSEGMGSFQEYAVNPKGDGLARSEGSFTKAAREGSGGVRDIAKLYLARIAVLKGMKEQARRLYTEVDRSASSDVLKRLSEEGLQDLDKKQ